MEREEPASSSLYLFQNDTNSGDLSNGGNNEFLCIPSSDGFMVFLVACMGICVFGMVGNGIVLWFLGFQMKRNHFTVYILNVAVADWCLLLLFFLHFFVLSSLGLLTAISMERCVSVVFPIWYRCHSPKHLSGIVSGVLWASVGAFILSCYLCVFFGKGYYTLFASAAVVYFVILSLTMLISNVAMLIRLRCGSQRRHLGKLYVAVVLNVIFFFAFGMPFSAEVFLDLSRSHDLFPENTTLMPALLNSSVNPVIYFLVGSCWQRRFRGSIKVTLCRVFEEKARSKEESPVPEGIRMESSERRKEARRKKG
uniref:G-protein coupled receptors family 1 profile domain-containing protein n=1 Tax=Strigops habroptila TaxID=2489341 RepID=A0A672V585_STRHB